MFEDVCDDELLDAPDVDCADYKNAKFTIDEVYYTNVNAAPLVLASGSGTDEEKLTTAIAARLALSTEERFEVVKLKGGAMPFGTGAFKTDPNYGYQIEADEDTDMSIGGIEYRDNQELYLWLKSIMGKPIKVYFKQGTNWFGGLLGVDGTFRNQAGVIKGAEMQNQVQWAFGWKGSTMPERLRVAA